MMEMDFLDVFYGENRATNFRAVLFRLIAKADGEHVERLRLGYPVEVALYEWFMNMDLPPRLDMVSTVARELEAAVR